MKAPIHKSAAIVFSASLDVRNYLRNQVGGGGFSVACFENESICYDNFGTIQPEMVVAETDAIEVVWRFAFALEAINAYIPLIIVSDRLEAGTFLKKGLQAPVNVIPIGHHGDRFLAELKRIKQTKGMVGIGSRNSRIPLLVGQTEHIMQIRSMLPNIADSRDPVLIYGEQGTGKELLARLISRLNKSREFLIKIDCAEFQPEMLVNGGLKKTLGVGNKGKPMTIFLDHLDQLPMASQAEMLLLIEASLKHDNGSGAHSNYNIRFIAATDQKIERHVQQGDFRKDLFYRLNVIPVSMPALRERKEDISMLMDYFIIKASTKLNKCIRIPSQQARERCYMYDWPGNVEELQYKMHRVADTGSEKILIDSRGISEPNRNTREYLFNSSTAEQLPTPYEIKDSLPILKNMSLKSICYEFVSRTERRLIKKALESTNWNRKKAAELLNISYKSMLNKIKVYDIF